MTEIEIITELAKLAGLDDVHRATRSGVRNNRGATLRYCKFVVDGRRVYAPVPDYLGSRDAMVALIVQFRQTKDQYFFGDFQRHLLEVIFGQPAAERSHCIFLGSMHLQNMLEAGPGQLAQAFLYTCGINPFK